MGDATERRLHEQIEFLCAIDELKNVQRQTTLLDGSRRENSAEHSWHLAPVRDVARRLDADSRIERYSIEAENFESIHNHSAYARIDRRSD